MKFQLFILSVSCLPALYERGVGDMISQSLRPTTGGAIGNPIFTYENCKTMHPGLMATAINAPVQRTYCDTVYNKNPPAPAAKAAAKPAKAASPATGKTTSTGPAKKP